MVLNRELPWDLRGFFLLVFEKGSILSVKLLIVAATAATAAAAASTAGEELALAATAAATKTTATTTATKANSKTMTSYRLTSEDYSGDEDELQDRRPRHIIMPVENVVDAVVDVDVVAFVIVVVVDVVIEPLLSFVSIFEL